MFYLTWSQIKNLVIITFVCTLIISQNSVYVLSKVKNILILWVRMYHTQRQMLLVIKLVAVLLKVDTKFFKKSIKIYTRSYMIVVNYYKKLVGELKMAIKKLTLKQYISKNFHKALKIEFIPKKTWRLLDSVILHKPIYNSNIKLTSISKLFIRKSRFFTKTKYSSIRQECKNIVHFTLLFNTVFISIVFNVYMRWTFLPGFPIIILFIIIVYLLPLVLRVNAIINFYSQFFTDK